MALRLREADQRRFNAIKSAKQGKHVATCNDVHHRRLSHTCVGRNPSMSAPLLGGERGAARGQSSWIPGHAQNEKRERFYEVVCKRGSLRPFRVSLDVETRSIEAGPTAVMLQPVEFVIYHEFARAKLDQCGNTRRLACGDCMACYLSVEELHVRRESMLQLLARLYRSGSGRLERVHASWSHEDGFPPEVIRSHISAMNRRLKDNGLDCLRVASNRQYGNTRYGLKVEKRLIEVLD